LTKVSFTDRSEREHKIATVTVLAATAARSQQTLADQNKAM
jgi:hypothetical protein